MQPVGKRRRPAVMNLPDMTLKSLFTDKFAGATLALDFDFDHTIPARLFMALIVGPMAKRAPAPWA